MRTNILLAIASILFSLLLLELIVRFFRLAPNIDNLQTETKSAYRISTNPILGYELKANYTDKHPDLNESFPKINSAGQRDIERNLEKPKGIRRIIMLGDSVVAGHGIYDLNNTISRRLEKLLEKDNKLEVLNFGVGGYTFRAEIELLKVKALRYYPDTVIIVFLANDIDSGNGQMMTYAASLNRWVKIAFEKSALLRYLILKFDLYGIRSRLGRMEVHRAFIENKVEEGFQILRGLSLQHNFETFIVFWPHFPDKKNKTLGEADFIDDRKVIGAIEQLAKKYNIPTYRIYSFFSKDYSAILSRSAALTPTQIYTIGDEMHPNAYGSYKAALAIRDILIQRRTISQ